MQIYSEKISDELILKLSGRLDTVSAPQLEQIMKQMWAGNKRLILDLDDIDYISSAGLRVILMCQKQVSRDAGNMIVKNVCPPVMEVFRMTGFDRILQFEAD